VRALKGRRWVIAILALLVTVGALVVWTILRFDGFNEDLREAARNEQPPCQLEADGTGCMKPRK